MEYVRAAFSAAAIAVVAAPAQSGEAQFIGLGHFPQLPGTKAWDCTPDGKVVIGVATTEDGPEAFRWTEGHGLVGLGDLPGGAYQSIATALSTSGTLVVGWSSSANGEKEAFRWSSATGMIGLGDLPGGEFLSTATGCSANGSTVVGWSTSGPERTEAFRWTPVGGMEGLGELKGGIFASRAASVSGAGSLICGWGSSGVGVDEAFLWTPSTGMVGLGFIPGAFLDGSKALDISFTGDVLVGSGWAEIGVQAMRWSAENGMTALGDLPGGGAQPFSFAYAVSADGNTIVGAGTTGVDSMIFEAFIWDAVNGMRNLRTVLQDAGLDLSGWILSEARGISAFGDVVVGWGYHDGAEEAWLARLPVDEMEPCLGDLNGDGMVSMVDMLMMLNLFGDCPDCDDCPADLNGDCVVNMADVTLLFGAWGLCE